jgi:farnesyl diphosphate synthase
MPGQCVDNLSDLLAPYAASAQRQMDRLLVEDGVPPELADALRYCAMGSGKRLRPALVYMACEAVTAGEPDDLAHRAAVAVELVHTYSLVHDDLPAMDDDVLRRGRPTAHVQFGEAMAILAGDALLTRAFGVLSVTGDPRAASLCAVLAHAAGGAGMVAGQVADMNLCRNPEGLEGLRFIHLHKTADMIRAATKMGAICGRANPEILDALARYGESLGLAFQLIDDLLDVTGSAEDLGKTPGKDAAAGKRTHAAEVGADRAAEMGRRLTADAVDALRPLGERAEKLRRLARLLERRTR